ncbi:hypothetical protein GUJ93_ZPchr0005g15764 [Zizania palustris]|uniref:Uncharacterized protein n=1 Tax=Zizania palustris TaxID=103762 RepID=A0A8J5VCK7_ZIZPA|nr:hypothetical protein GUJ93_ZPchr0005g15764 [Zizania palustris]KAG8067098.1 hypothetical protein GUJ93_ZPchr0005g15764 [Zizania palustris]
MLCLFLSSIKSKEIAHKLMGLAGPTSCLLGLMSSWLALVPAPAPAPARPPPRRPFHFKATSRAPSISSGGVSRGCNTTVRSLPQPHRRRSFMEAQSQPPPVAAVAVRRDATTGLAFLLFVLSVVMISFLSLAMISFPTWRVSKSSKETLPFTQIQRSIFLCKTLERNLFFIVSVCKLGSAAVGYCSA